MYTKYMYIIYSTSTSYTIYVHTYAAHLRYTNHVIQLYEYIYILMYYTGQV